MGDIDCVLADVDRFARQNQMLRGQLQMLHKALVIGAECIAQTERLYWDMRDELEAANWRIEELEEECEDLEDRLDK